MTPLQIQDLVAEKLKGFLDNPQVTVTVIEIRSKRAFITGDGVPGPEPIRSTRKQQFCS